MGIPLCEKSVFPFVISIKLTADDFPPTKLCCQISMDQLSDGRPVAFGAESQSAIPLTLPLDGRKRLISPTSSSGKELLKMILDHSVPEQRGLTEILSSPEGPLHCAFIPDISGSGMAVSLRKSVLREAIDELLQLGWLRPPEGEGRTRVYELNPEASQQDSPV
jgi:hypothetical protein